MHFEDIAAELASGGLRMRGGFHPEPADDVPAVRAGVAARTVLLVGNIGSADWRAFASSMPPGSDPLDGWTRSRVHALALTLQARDVYPCDRPFLPFQRWARRAQDVHFSPLGLLIHPQYGLWHAYRAALLLPVRLDVPDRGCRPSPCDACAAKPCLSACPAGSFGPDGFDSASCHAHLASREGHPCLDRGCKARNACPVGRTHRYLPEQMRFHMRAFHDGST